MINLPKDAEGREIPLDTVELFGGNGNAYNITGWMYVTDFDSSNSTAGQWRALTDKFSRLDPELMYLTPPDSWEKLEEDLDKGKDICDYFEDCPEDMYGKSCSECKKAALKNIASRIRKLRGEDDA